MNAMTQRVAHRWLRKSGLLEPPPRMVDAISTWAQAHPWGTGDTKTRLFKTNLQGWKHLKTWQSSVAQRYKRAPNGDDEEYLKALGLEKLEVVLVYQWTGHPASGNFSNLGGPTIRLNLQNPVPVHQLHTIVAHELRHFAQTLLSGGKPPKQIRTPEIPRNTKTNLQLWGPEEILLRQRLQQLRIPITEHTFHALRDIEFYTNLADATETFKTQTAGLKPADLRQALHYFTGSKQPPTKHELTQQVEQQLLEKQPYSPMAENQVRQYVQQYVQQHLQRLKPYQHPHRFFQALKAAPGKWRKAVGEMAAAVL